MKGLCIWFDLVSIHVFHQGTSLIAKGKNESYAKLIYLFISQIIILAFTCCA